MGLDLSGNTIGIKAAYGAVAGTIWLLWMSLAALTFLRARGENSTREKPYIRRINSYD